MKATEKLERLKEAKNIDDVVRNLDRIIDWSIKAPSAIGYFAVLYKRGTVAVRDAIKAGKFDDGPRMDQFDTAFAQRYFNALNAYFYPGEYDGLTLAWEVAFASQRDSQATIMQQMMASLNSHICFDLGITAFTVAGNALDKFEHDFNLVNSLVSAQIPDMLNVLDRLSPDVIWIRRLIPSEIKFIKELLITFRTAAWHFAIYLALYPESAKEKEVNQAAWTAGLGAFYLQPPLDWTAFPLLARIIRMRESKDVARNVRAFDGRSRRPEKRTRALP